MDRIRGWGTVLSAAVLCSTVSAESVPIDSERWTLKAQEQRIEEHLGRRSRYLKGGVGWIEGVSFADGMIEFDIAFDGERGFVGAVWRVQDPRNYEEFYLRPHMSGDPDANQYTPIFHDSAGWQLYHGDGYGAPVSYPTNEWLSVRIVFAGSRGEVYIGDMDEPALAIHELKREVRAGSVGIMAGNFAPAWFSNFRFAALENPPLKSSPRTASETPDAIRSWLVSGIVEEGAVDGVVELSEKLTRNLSWSRLGTEPDGLANLARVQGIEENRNTAFARVILEADRSTLTRFRFGYSDRARVFLNGRLLYVGNNDYRSRDYRFLGTIGLFDELLLPLEPGSNELWVAVSESFGGWGLMATLDRSGGVSVRLEP